MTSVVSYANVAAKGTNPATEAEITKTVQDEGENNTDSVVADAEVSGTSGKNTENSATSEKSTKKEKKVLAPAPVPAKSVWGESSASSGITTSVDESKWPTPDKVSELENDAVTKNSQQKFIKPITNKWVPINAKVVLPNPRNNNQKQNRNRKAKKQNAQNAQSNQKKQGNQNVVSTNENPQAQINKKDQVHHNDQVEKSFEQQGEVDESSQQFDTMQQDFQQGQKQFQDNFRPRFNSNGSSQQKNFRRFNNGGPQQYKQRFNNGNQHQNGFFHPQPFIQNQAFNNRQFRNQNIGHRNYRQFNGYRNGNIGLQQVPQIQIPPPISPKQDPRQALTQQIDYYFSLENLIRDVFLRKNMSEEGWVALSLILDFKRVKIIINGIQNSIEDKEIDPNAIILDSIQACENLEINYLKDSKDSGLTIDDVQLRVKDNYQQWLLPADQAN